MFTLIRRIHLYTGMVLLVFVLMYFVTGYAIVHRTWFNQEKPTPTTRSITLHYSAGDLPIDNPEAAAGYVQNALDLPGQRRPPRPPKQSGGPWQFDFSYPGESCQVTLKPIASAATAIAAQSADLIAAVTITQTRTTAFAKLNSFHRLRGGGGWKYELWGIAFDAASIALILFAASGVYLWFRLTKVRWPGLLTLAAGMALTLSTYAYLLIAR